MATTTYEFARYLDYPSIVATSERVAWTVDGVFNGRCFDASKAIVPESWVRTGHWERSGTTSSRCVTGRGCAATRSMSTS
jgi:hypothetical protein